MAMLNNQMVNHQTSGCGSPPLFINFGPGLSGRTAFVSPTCENISPEDNEIVEELEEGQRDEDLKCIYNIYILVGGFKHFLFSTIYGIILPID